MMVKLTVRDEEKIGWLKDNTQQQMNRQTDKQKDKQAGRHTAVCYLLSATETQEW